MPAAARTRQTADERREAVLAAAVAEFAVAGYHGTPTDAIAKRAGISQPYLFRLYGTKKDLFLACCERGFDRITATFRAAAADPPADAESPLHAMGEAYKQMLEDRELLLFQLQVYAAAADEHIQEVARRRYEGIIDEIERLSGATQEEVRAFLGSGMLLNVAAALGIPADRLDAPA